MTSPPPPPPPEEEPTVVAPAGRRREYVDEEVAGPPPVIRPYPWWLWVLAGIFQGLSANKHAVASTKPNGIVVAQDPPENTKVAKGTIVGLAVSNGQGQVKVPSVQGQSSADAVKAVTDAGLIPIVIQVPSSKPTGTVIAQDPAPNQQVAAGSNVRLNASGGPAATKTTT